MKFILIVLVVLILGGGYYYLQNTSSDKTTMPTNTLTPPPATGTPTPTGTNIKTFTVVGNNFTFDVKEMRVKQGDTVQVTVTNAEGFHDFVLDEFSVRTSQLQAGTSETIQFVANKAGTFEYYCSVGSHRQMGMVGKLIVE